MSVIHGGSHAAIKYFREKPAALAVYWLYCSRTNAEGVAWPGLRDLEENTGWNKGTCGEARKWLVNRSALKQVENYIRPEWRDLSEGERQQRLDFDHAEYYRVTGHIIIAGTLHQLLYYPALVQDVRPDRTTLSDATGQNLFVVGASSSDDERPRVYSVYEQNIGMLTPLIVDSLRDLVRDYGEAWVCDAIEHSVKAEKRSLKYVEGILTNWRRDGRDVKLIKGGGDKKADPLLDGLIIT